MTAYLGWY